jgi:hypothetical protein
LSAERVGRRLAPILAAVTSPVLRLMERKPCLIIEPQSLLARTDKVIE